jgi:putative ABC transport system substrate-binding protein
MLGATAAGLLLFASQAQGQQPVHRVGVLRNMDDPAITQAWLEGLCERGYDVGRNLQVEYRFWRARTEQIPALVAELVAVRPEVIVAATRPSAVAVHSAAPTIPLVFLNLGDPVGSGLVESLRHPGGNVTGFVSTVHEGFSGKHLQTLKELVPQASRIAVLINSTNPVHQRARAELPEIGRQLGVVLIIVNASKPDQLETAFEIARSEGAEAIDIWGDPLVFTHSAKVVGLAARYQLPTIYFERRYVLEGGLVSFGPNPLDPWRRISSYVDKILKGENAGDLPVQQPTGYELVVNLKTAAALGITVPPLILSQADEVIE